MHPWGGTGNDTHPKQRRAQEEEMRIANLQSRLLAKSTDLLFCGKSECDSASGDIDKAEGFRVVGHAEPLGDSADAHRAELLRRVEERDRLSKTAAATERAKEEASEIDMLRCRLMEATRRLL